MDQSAIWFCKDLRWAERVVTLTSSPTQLVQKNSLRVCVVLCGASKDYTVSSWAGMAFGRGFFVAKGTNAFLNMSECGGYVTAELFAAKSGGGSEDVTIIEVFRA